MTRTDFQIPADPRFATTEYVVEATATERELLSWRWTHLGGVAVTDDGCLPFARAIGYLGADYGEAPVYVGVRWSAVGGRRVAFVSGTSQVVDCAMIRDWCRDVFPCLREDGVWQSFDHLVAEIRARDGLPVDPPDVAARVDEAVQASSSLVRRRITGLVVAEAAGTSSSGVVSCPSCGDEKDVGPGPTMVACGCMRGVYMDAAVEDGEIVRSPTGGRWLVPQDTEVSRVALADPGFRVLVAADTTGGPGDQFTILMDQFVAGPGDLGESKIVEVVVDRGRLEGWSRSLARVLGVAAWEVPGGGSN